MSASSVLQSRLTTIAKERAQAMSNLELAETARTRALADIERLDGEKAALDAALAQLGS